MRKHKHLTDAYRFPGFTPGRIKGIFGDPKSLVIQVKRRGKKLSVPVVGWCIAAITTKSYEECGTYPAETVAPTWSWRYAGSNAENAAW